MSRTVRVLALALAFVVAGCVARSTVSTAPSESPSGASVGPTSPPSPTPRINATTDVLYVRQYAGGGDKEVIAVVDARTGSLRGNLPGGALSPDRTLVYSTESADGGTRTIVHVRRVDTAEEIRSFSLAGQLALSGSGSIDESLSGAITRDGKRLVLHRPPGQVDGKWVNEIAIVDVTSGDLFGRIDLTASATYGFIALSGDRVAILNEFGNGATTMRAFDLVQRSFLPDPAFAGWDGRQAGYRTPFTPSADGRWLYAVDSGGATSSSGGEGGPFVIALDLVARRAIRVALPTDQGTHDLEKYLLWTLTLAPDGASLYAINAALGVVDEIDARQPALRRAQRLSRAEPSVDPVAGIRQALFPVADAKRYLRGGATISPDGRTAYAVADKGIVAIDTATLAQSRLWMPDKPFDSLALSADGLRLYAINGDGRRISILDTRSGTCTSSCQESIGEITLFGFLSAIVRIDSR